jgi:hypothetical protein
MIISTVYLPEITVNVRYQRELFRSTFAGQTNCSVMTGTVRQCVLIIARLQVLRHWSRAERRARVAIRRPRGHLETCRVQPAL